MVRTKIASRPNGSAEENPAPDDLSIDPQVPLVIVNPHSAGGSTRHAWAEIASDLRAHFGPFAVAFTKAPGDAAVLAKSAALKGRKFVIACGGDGTINEVANGIIDSGADTELGILPSGTGGDLRRTIGIPSEPREAAARLRDGVTRVIDAGKVSFIGIDGEPLTRYFLNVSSFGLAASIIERVKSTKLFDWLPARAARGQANFAASTLQQVLDTEPATVKIRIDGGEETQLRTINFCVANARYFGGGMLIAPEANIADGEFDIVNIGDISTAKIIARAYTLYRGTHLSLREVGSRRAKRVEVRPANDAEDIRLETDGELPGRLPATFEIVPKAIRIRAPK